MEKDNSIPVFSLDAVLRKDLSTATKIFNIHDMEYYLWVRVSKEIARDYSFYEFDEVDSNEKYDINIFDFCWHEPNRIWFKFNSMLLSRKSGKHIYRMHFTHNQTGNTISLYFSYVVQRQDVDKPYIYMPEQVQKMKEARKI